jgi:hypothetical protein
MIFSFHEINDIFHEDKKMKTNHKFHFRSRSRLKLSFKKYLKHFEKIFNHETEILIELQTFEIIYHFVCCEINLKKLKLRTEKSK